MRRRPRRRAVAALLLTSLLPACAMERSDPARGGAAARATGAAEAPSAQAPDAGRDAELIEAAEAGDQAEVSRLLADGASVAARDDRGRTALVAAAYGNHVETARVLLAAGADVDVKDDSEQNAYLIATSEVGDDTRLLEVALAAGADPQAKDSFNGTGLIRAAHRGYPRVIDRLLRAGVEVDHVNELGWTALLEAVILGDGSPRYVETVRLLLAGGADPDVPDRGGVRALTHAERRGQTAVVELLRAAGAKA